jgi:hypothetical protein
VRVGEAAMREVAAYLLDHNGFAKVPVSCLVRAQHPAFCYNNILSSARYSHMDLTSLRKSISSSTSSPNSDLKLPMKLGSLQEFVRHDCDTSEIGSSRFSKKDVQRIGIFDIRLFNTDRHAGNMLVRKIRESSVQSAVTDGQYEIIPIDHGFALPEHLEAPYFEWLHWPQAMHPFGEDELAYIRALDVEADKEMLKRELPNLRPECIRVLEVSTTLLKLCAEAGLTLSEIGTVCSRPFMDEDQNSELEQTCETVWEKVKVRSSVSPLL